jgi:hypothetical protein
MSSIKITREEAILLYHYLSDSNLEKMVSTIFQGNRNIMMILSRIVCDIESGEDFMFSGEYESIISESEKKLIEQFGDMNIIS